MAKHTMKSKLVGCTFLLLYVLQGLCWQKYRKRCGSVYFLGYTSPLFSGENGLNSYKYIKQRDLENNVKRSFIRKLN